MNTNTNALRALLLGQRTAALGTLSDHHEAFVSRVPYAIDGEQGRLIIHVSSLAAHTGNLLRHPRASLLVAEAEVLGEPVHALQRVSVDVIAEPCEPGRPQALRACAIYLARFPEAEPITQLGDFRFMSLKPLGARQVAGFGAARSLSAQDLALAMGASL